jgi:hypothetical protein
VADRPAAAAPNAGTGFDNSTKFWRSGYDQFSATTYGNGGYTVTIKAT